MKSQDKLNEESLVSYDELSAENSHFEVAYLAFQKAIEIIRSAEYLKNYSQHVYKHKPKVAVLALQALCDNPTSAMEFKSATQSAMFTTCDESEQIDDYNVDAGHLPEVGFDTPNE